MPPTTDLSHGFSPLSTLAKRAALRQRRTNRRGEAGSPDLLAICWKQWATERELRRRGIDFRTTNPEAARAAYAAMTADEFAAINGRQAWANRRTLRRALAGLLPNHPIEALDLGCGIGESTRTLASLLPAGSSVLGVEFAAPLVEVARSQSDPARGRDVEYREVQYVVGSVTETFRDAAGRPLGDKRFDLINAAGVMGHHLSRSDVMRALAEIARVVRADGLVALDYGPKLGQLELRSLLKQFGFTLVRSARSNLFDRCGQVVARLA